MMKIGVINLHHISFWATANFIDVRNAKLADSSDTEWYVDCASKLENVALYGS